jgi:hypothetical protein
LAISLDTLVSASNRRYTSRFRSLTEAKQLQRAGFLCHSHHDKELVLGVLALMAEAGLDLYVDWQDHTMPETPDRRTAEGIKEAIGSSNYFFFLATPNSTVSRWCPWEIGVADGFRMQDRILIIPTVDRSARHYGNEYLQLYRQIDMRGGTQLKVFLPGSGVGIPMSQL